MKTRMLVFAKGTILFSLVSLPHLAQAQVVKITTSPGCGAVQTRAEKVVENNDLSIGATGESCRAYFNDFNVQLDHPGIENKDCRFEALIKVPAGEQFRATVASLEGVYSLDRAATGSVDLSYSLDATGGRAGLSESFGQGSQGDFNLYAKIDNDDFTVCSDQDQYVTLSSDINLALADPEGGLSYVDVDEQGKSYQLSWHWQRRYCYFEKPFVSYYKAYNKRNYQAMIELNGNHGTYTSDAGFVGQLYDVTYSLDGKVAEGKWQALGVSGWFRFTMIDVAEGRFKGEWGDHQGTQGTWWGYHR